MGPAEPHVWLRHASRQEADPQAVQGLLHAVALRRGSTWPGRASGCRSSRSAARLTAVPRRTCREPSLYRRVRMSPMTSRVGATALLLIALTLAGCGASQPSSAVEEGSTSPAASTAAASLAPSASADDGFNGDLEATREPGHGQGPAAQARQCDVQAHRHEAGSEEGPVHGDLQDHVDGAEGRGELVPRLRAARMPARVEEEQRHAVRRARHEDPGRRARAPRHRTRRQAVRRRCRGTSTKPTSHPIRPC